jgi:hypothetical protein
MRVEWIVGTALGAFLVAGSASFSRSQLASR